jgi:hypothetical protein
MSMLCGRSRTLQIVDGTQTSLSAPDMIHPSSFRTHGASRFRLSHTRTDLSSEPETIRLPSGENATDRDRARCVLAAPSTACPSLHPTPALICRRNQRRFGCHQAKMRPTRPSWCVLAAPSTARPSLHPTLALICRRNQRRFGCHQAKMRPTGPAGVSLQLLQLLARLCIPHPH